MARKKQDMRKREESKIDQAKHKANVGHSEKKNSVIGELQKNPLMASIVGATLMGGQDAKPFKRDNIPKNHSSLS